MAPNFTEEYEDVTEETNLDLPTSPMDAQRLLLDRALNRGKWLHSESSAADEMSLHTVPSMFSLVSIPSHFEGLNINTDNNEVCVLNRSSPIYSAKMMYHGLEIKLAHQLVFNA